MAPLVPRMVPAYRPGSRPIAQAEHCTPNLITGTPGSDTLTSSAPDNRLSELDGDDVLVAGPWSLCTSTPRIASP